MLLVMPENDSANLAIRCSCGSVQGTAEGVTPANTNRLLCYCDDCQAFVHYLERPKEFLDPNGGSDVVQMSAGRIRFSEGQDKLTCVRLTKSGLVRWYSSCCNSPLGTTMPTRQIPFVGLIRSSIESTTNGSSVDEAIGPVRARVQGRFAVGNTENLGVSDKPPFGVLMRLARILLGARFRGDHLKSPYFDSQSAEPVVAPRVLSTVERQKLEEARVTL